LETRTVRKVFLTFDVEGPPGKEDFMDVNTLKALQGILKLLEKYRLRALFLITGSVAERIVKDLEIAKLLNEHEIGFHSSSHSTKPRILEYIDVPDYKEAVNISVLRESSRIDPITGEIIGKGGILLLRELFVDKRIESFRAPFNCFLPPHIEGLRDLGVRFVFSGSFSREPVSYKGITFYPEAMFIDDLISKFAYFNHLEKTFSSPIISSAKGEKTVVFALHPSRMIYNKAQSSKAFFKNPMRPLKVKKYTALKRTFNFEVFKLLLFTLSKLQKKGFIDVTPKMDASRKQLNPNEAIIEKNLKRCSCIAQRLFGYKPKFISSHYYYFFEQKPPITKENCVQY